MPVNYNLPIPKCTSLNSGTIITLQGDCEIHREIGHTRLSLEKNLPISH